MTIAEQHRHWILLPALALLTGCGGDAPGSDPAGALPEPMLLAVPAAPGGVYPHVAGGAGEFILSWTEPAGIGHALRFATLPAGDVRGAIVDGSPPHWSEPRTIATGPNWFVNWADFPSVVSLPDGALGAHWLQRSGPGTYAYDVMVSQSADGGATWTEPVRPHGDGTETEHGFVSLFAHDQALAAVWLDGRRFDGWAGEEPTREMTVRFTTVRDGRPATETLIDARACDCCQTTAVITDDGPLVAYRDRSDAEIRDIVVTRLVAGSWTEPTPVHEDGWHITGCPVNGPQADASGRTVAIAWFTQADDEPRVLTAFSSDAGASFAAPVRVDEGAPLGRVDLLLLADGRALVVWLERTGEEAEIRGRIVSEDGVAGPARRLAPTSAQRGSGFPRMARAGDVVLLAWTDVAAQPSAVRAAIIDLGR